MRILVDGQTLSTPEVHRGIGRVMLQLCNEMLPSDPTQEWFFAVKAEDDLLALGEDTRRYARPLVCSSLALGTDRESRTKSYSEELRQLCVDHDLDLYWNPNPLMLNVILPLQLTDVLKVGTVHDLIPLSMSESYRDTWPSEERDEYDRRVRELPKWANHLIFISDASRAEYARFDSSVAHQSSVVRHGVDRTTFWCPVLPTTPTEPPYVLLVGGADQRKNMRRAIVAFADATREAPNLENMRLVIVGSGEGEFREGLVETATANHVLDRVDLHSFVDDRTLAQLYRRASLLFFPSLREGFGLPVLEAMASGTPVLVSDRPELLEMARDFAFVCDPEDEGNMRAGLIDALTNRDRNLERRPSLVTHANAFDWSESGARYSQIFESLTLESLQRAQTSRRRRVAWLSPWPPSRTGVADYSAELAGTLRARIDIDLFVENPNSVDSEAGWTARPLEEIRERHADYDVLIYHLGNNAKHHTAIYRLAWEIPGIVVLHDLNIHPFLHQAFFGTADEHLYGDALTAGYGETGRAHFDAVRRRECEPNIWHYPLSEAIASRSRAVIVHSASAREDLNTDTPVWTVPHFARDRDPRSPDEISRVRAALDLSPDEFVIGVFGFINSHKRIPVVLEACARLRANGYPIRLALVGSNLDPDFLIESHIEAHGMTEFTTLTGYVDDDAFWDYLDASDVVVNLRWPSMGESSGSLFRSLASGKPCLVTDIPPFSEIPDFVCWKAQLGPHEIDQVVAYLEELLCDPELRRQLGESARRYVSNYASKERAAVLYESAIATCTASREPTAEAREMSVRLRG